MKHFFILLAFCFFAPTVSAGKFGVRVNYELKDPSKNICKSTEQLSCGGFVKVFNDPLKAYNFFEENCGKILTKECSCLTDIQRKNIPLLNWLRGTHKVETTNNFQADVVGNIQMTKDLYYTKSTRTNTKIFIENINSFVFDQEVYTVTCNTATRQVEETEGKLIFVKKE